MDPDADDKYDDPLIDDDDNLAVCVITSLCCTIATVFSYAVSIPLGLAVTLMTSIVLFGVCVPCLSVRRT